MHNNLSGSATAEKLMTADEVAARLGVTRRFVDKMVSDGRFPAPLSLGGRLKRWRPEDVSDHIDQLAKDAGPPGAAA